MPTKLEELQDKLKELRIDRDKAVMEKGFAAEENKDLRENFAYDHWESKEHVLTSRIKAVTKEIHLLTVKKKAVTSKKPKKDKPVEVGFKPHKWL